MLLLSQCEIHIIRSEIDMQRKLDIHTTPTWLLSRRILIVIIAGLFDAYVYY